MNYDDELNDNIENNNLLTNIAGLLGKIAGIIKPILAILGIIGYINGNYLFTYIAAAFDLLIPTFFSIIIAALTGLVLTGTIQGMCFALCIEEIIVTGFGLLLLIVMGIKNGLRR